MGSLKKDGKMRPSEDVRAILHLIASASDTDKITGLSLLLRKLHSTPDNDQEEILASVFEILDSDFVGRLLKSSMLLR